MGPHRHTSSHWSLWAASRPTLSSNMTVFSRRGRVQMTETCIAPAYAPRPNPPHLGKLHSQDSQPSRTLYCITPRSWTPRQATFSPNPVCARGVVQDVSQRAQRAGADGKWAIPRWGPLHPNSSHLLWLRSSPHPFHWEQLILALSNETFNESDDKTLHRVYHSLGVSGSSVKSFSLELDQRERKPVIWSFGSRGQHGEPMGMLISPLHCLEGADD